MREESAEQQLVADRCLLVMSPDARALEHIALLDRFRGFLSLALSFVSSSLCELGFEVVCVGLSVD